MRIERVWAMPSSRTFSIKPIAELLKEEASIGHWLDPFPYPFKEDAKEFLKKYGCEEVDGVLFDPPYSPRQLKECYDSLGQSLHDTKSSVWSEWKDETSRVIKVGGKCISFGWSSQGMGKNRGFEITRILLVPHGGMHNDTICVVETKVRGVDKK